jgi:hypothetical protein
LFDTKRGNNFFEASQSREAEMRTAKKNLLPSIIYHDDFLIPGISPLFANSLKHILQSPNFLIKPCRLPHLKQRRIILLGNFGFILAFASCDTFAI